MSKRIFTLGALLALAVAISIAGTASAAVYKVDKRADRVNSDSNSTKCKTSKAKSRTKKNGGKATKPDCTLRAAIQAANAKPGLDKLVLQKKNYRLKISGTGEDDAKTGDLDVSSKIVIGGRGASIAGKGVDRIFDVSSDGDLNLRNVKVFGGSPAETESGGGIRNAGSLVLKRSSIGGNSVTGEGASGGGVFNDAGSLRVNASDIVSNSAVRAGGGIETNAGDVTIENGSSLGDNDAGPTPGNGGGLHVTGAGTVAISDSTVSGNSATAEGGGLWNSAGGTMSVDGTVIDKNTAAGNDADQGGGGLYNDGGNLSVLDSSKITANLATGTSGSGGGLLNVGGAIEARNSTFADNVSSRAGGAIETNIGGVALIDVDLLRNTTGPTPGNGGGLHVTGAGVVAVLDGNVTGNSATAEGGGLWNSATGTMTIDGTFVNNNAASGNDADQGGGGLYNDGGALTVRSSATIDGNAANGTSGSGGGVLTLGPLVVNNSTISNNSASRAGGGIETTVGRVDLTNARLIANATGAAPGNGGGLHSTGAATVNVTDSVVRANTATEEGGGLWNSATGTMTVDSTRILANTASGPAADQGGGGLYNNGGALIVQNDSQVDGNVADGAAGSGGGVLNLGGLTVTDSTISTNSAVRAGGGIETTTGTVNLTGARLLSNSTSAAPGNGGGLHVTGAGTVNVTDGVVRGNTAAAEGGGLWNGTGTMTVDSTVIKNNVASGADATNGGGGIYQLTGGTLVVQNGTSIVGNSANGAAGSGGGILNDGATVTVTSSELVDNDASRAGGGIESNLDAAATTVASTLFDGNSTGAAPGNGGAIHVTAGGTVTVDGSTFTNNAAANEGGAVWNSPTGTLTVTDSSLSNGVTAFTNGNTARAAGGPNGYQETGGAGLTINGVAIAAGDPGV